jgi:hypothetical protein
MNVGLLPAVRVAIVECVVALSGRFRKEVLPVPS